MKQIQLEIIGNSLLAIAEEMGASLIRSSYSTNIKERRDCSTAVFDAQGQLIAQAEHIPMHLGSLSGIVNKIRDLYPAEEVNDGDMFIANDPYNGGGTHLPDISVAQPYFSQGELVGYLVNIGHHADGANARTRTIQDEGLRISPVKIAREGVLDERLYEMILLNFRVQHERRGDFRAQFAANRKGAESLDALIEKHGLGTVKQAMSQLLDYGERKTRAAIGEVPDGDYSFTDYMDDDGRSTTNIPIVVNIQVADDRMVFDFEGTGDQVEGDINCVLNATLATVYYSVKAALDPTIPPNGGLQRAITVKAPEGSIVNAVEPAGVEWRTDTCQRVADAIFGALGDAVPQKAPASTHGTCAGMAFSGTRADGRPYFYLDVIGGGTGGRPHGHGLDAVQVHITNTSNLPIEAMEHEYPLRVEEYSLVDGSGGEGQFHGGNGIRRTVTAIGSTSRFLGHTDRFLHVPWGQKGGKPGKSGRFVLNAGQGGEEQLPSKVYGLDLKPGESIMIESPGGGGYGAPEDHRASSHGNER